MTTIEITYNGEVTEVKYAPGIRFAHFKAHNNLTAIDQEEQASAMFLSAQSAYAITAKNELANVNPDKATTGIIRKSGKFIRRTTLQYNTDANADDIEGVKEWAKKKLVDSIKAQDHAKEFMKEYSQFAAK